MRDTDFVGAASYCAGALTGGVMLLLGVLAACQ